MFRYLRIQAMTGSLSQRMLDHGNYTFMPGRYAAQDVPNQAPAPIHEVLDHLELYED